MLGSAGSWIMKRIMILCFNQLYHTFVWDCCDDLTVEMQTPLLPLFFLTLVGDRERGCFRWADNYRRWWWNLLIKIGAYFFLFFVVVCIFMLTIMRVGYAVVWTYFYILALFSRIAILKEKVKVLWLFLLSFFPIYV